jgi:hypothetical protein
VRTMRAVPAHVAIAAILGVAAGCSLRASEPASEGEGRASPIRELERRAVGKAEAYPADVYTDGDAARFASSKKARRELGWRVLAKVLRPVPIAAASSFPAGRATVPLFRTWLGGDELDRMFAKMYGDLGRDRRLAHDTPTQAEVGALFAWNATSLGPNSEADFFARIAKVTSASGVDGLAGNGRTAYSPAYAKKYLEDYPSIAACDTKPGAFSLTTPPASEANFTDCFSSEFAPDAAVAKASWRRNDDLVADGLPVEDTSAATLTKRLARDIDRGGWPQSDLPMAAAGPTDAYTVALAGGERYSLVGLHVITKELRHWVWVTMWWSPNADEDFGQDRPPSIIESGAPWKNYKMCVVTDFDEMDPDPRGGYGGTLGDALAATHGPSTWCANPFLEKGDHNAGSNCIGCHQHAGDVAALPKVLSDEATYPRSGRTRVRTSFPADYSWAFTTPDSPDTKDRLQRMVVNRLRAYERADRDGDSLP